MHKIKLVFQAVVGGWCDRLPYLPWANIILKKPIMFFEQCSKIKIVMLASLQKN